MNTITPAAVFNISVKFPKYFEPGTDWEKRTKFTPNRQLQSQSGLLRTDIYAYAIETNKETKTQIAKQTHRRCLSKLNTPVERFSPELWDNERRQLVSSLGNFLTSYNANSMKLLSPAKSLSIDEMMIKFYGQSLVRQYIKSKPTKYGVKLWSMCCACCGYSLTQNIYLGSTVG